MESRCPRKWFWLPPILILVTAASLLPKAGHDPYACLDRIPHTVLDLNDPKSGDRALAYSGSNADLVLQAMKEGMSHKEGFVVTDEIHAAEPSNHSGGPDGAAWSFKQGADETVYLTADEFAIGLLYSGEPLPPDLKNYQAIVVTPHNPDLVQRT